MSGQRIEQGTIKPEVKIIPAARADGYDQCWQKSELAEFLDDIGDFYPTKNEQTRKQGKRK